MRGELREGETARQWFERQPYDTKIRILGAPLYEAYRQGRLGWEEMVRQGQDGRLIRAAPLRRLLGADLGTYQARAHSLAARRLIEPDWFEARDSLDRITRVLADLLGRPSRWNGEVELEEIALHSGVIRPNGSIGVLWQVWRDPVYRWRTLLHEALHTFSPPYTLREYRTLTGWEEGVVEQMQRLLRGRVLSTIGVQVPEESVAEIERAHKYNGYIRVLENLRGALEVPDEEFYGVLLRTALPERLAALQQMGSRLPEAARRGFRAQTYLAHAKLVRPTSGA